MTIDRRGVLGAIGSAVAAPYLLRATAVSAAAPAFTFLTPPIRLGTGQTGGQYNPALAVFGDGSFNAAWINDNGAGLRRAFVARYNINGSKRSAHVPLGAATGPTTGTQAYDVQPLTAAGGATVALFSAARNGAVFPNISEVFVQNLNASTVEVGNPAQLNSRLNDVQASVMGVRLTNGNYIAIWRQQGSTEASINIIGRVFNASGVPPFAEKVMTEKTSGAQTASAITALPNGHAAFAYSDYSITQSVRRDYVQELDATGNRVGAPKLIRQTSAQQPLGTASVDYLANLKTVAAYRVATVHNLTNLVWKKLSDNVARPIAIPFTINPFTTTPPFLAQTQRSNLFFIVDYHDLLTNKLGYAGVVVTPQNNAVVTPKLLGTQNGGFFFLGGLVRQRANDFIAFWHTGKDAATTNLRSYFRVVRLVNES